jgi:hypothetical protein
MVWPSVTATRWTEAVMGKAASRKPPFSKCPRMRSGSVSIFSSSPPPMNGSTLSSMSSEGTPG